jgi:hypothetical protein
MVDVVLLEPALPLLEVVHVRHRERQVVEAGAHLVEPVARAGVVLGQRHHDGALGVAHAGALEGRRLHIGVALEAHHVAPPGDAALPVTDGEAEVTEPGDRRHGSAL